MLTFHKHSPFHRLGIKPVNIKVGITAGVNTVQEVLPLASDCSDTDIIYQKNTRFNIIYQKSYKCKECSSYCTLFWWKKGI